MEKTFPHKFGTASRSMLVGLLMALTAPAWAESAQTWGKASDVLAMGLPAAAGALTLWREDVEGFKQLALSGASAVAASELLKGMVHARRPDGSDNQSFPSEHTAVAFTAAAYIDQRYGQELGPWRPALYGLASLTGVARVQADKHRWVDVFAGAALGYGTARYWTEPVQGGHLSVLPAPGGLALGWSRMF